uniref:ATPase, F1/V1/A1 complex, alpha/beta subunit, zinc knuckle CX2CX4HX4C n=1 Tax=Tanacetum cinerariifolium TaxID=118510 RepID=A0A699I7X9_TANCI|nr:ATPase, F1/V1/A1 complex, alpha/beta subunit, zinc knuckle CX2CX4HX4C [Tanacetum cinerariifolium]
MRGKEKKVRERKRRWIIQMRKTLQMNNKPFSIVEKGSSYARVMIKLRVDVDLKDNIIVAMPKINGEGHYICNVRVEYEWKPPSGNKKKGVVPYIEVSNSNTFEVFNSVDNDVELGTNERTTNLVNNEATSSGSSFMNIDNSSTRTTPIIDKIGKFKELLTSGKATLVDEAGNPLKKVEFRDDYDS